MCIGREAFSCRGGCLHPCFKRHGYIRFIPTPNDIIAHMGLRLGDLFAPGLDCSLRLSGAAHSFDSRKRDTQAGHARPEC